MFQHRQQHLNAKQRRHQAAARRHAQQAEAAGRRQARERRRHRLSPLSSRQRDDLDELRAQWQPFEFWQHQQQADRAEELLRSRLWHAEPPDFDLDLHGPGPLSQDEPEESTPEPDFAHGHVPPLQSPLGGGNGAVFRRPAANQWQQRFEEEMERQEDLKRQKEAADAQQWARRAAEEAAEAEPNAEADEEVWRQFRARSAANLHEWEQQQRNEWKQQQWQRTQWQQEQRKPSDTPPGPAAQAESPAMKARREQAAAAAAQREKQQREQRQRAAEKAKAEAKQRAAANVAVALNAYEGSWAALEEKVTAAATACATITISLADIVSPPDSCPLGIVLPDAASKDQKKQALRAASLRWHPDKFVAKFGRLLPVPSKDGGDASAREAILAKVTRTFQLINAERERLLPD